MTFREFNIALTRDPVLGKLLPLQLRRTYPWFRVEEGVLCACFVGFRVEAGQEGVKAFPPAYYLKITYPRGEVRSFERLARGGEGRAMTPQVPEDIRRLAALCDGVLEGWDGQSPELEHTLEEYQQLLGRVLEPEQRAVLERFLGST